MVARTILFVVLGASMLISGGLKKKTQHYARLITPEMETEWEKRIAQMESAMGPAASMRGSGVEWSAVVGETGYDFGTNTVSGRTIALTDDGNAHLVFMKRLKSAENPRHVTYNYADNALEFMWGEASIDESLGSTGSGRVQNFTNDAATVSFHGAGVWFYADADEANYAFGNTVLSGGPIGEGSSPGFALGSVIHYIYNSNEGGGFTPDSYYYSTDDGETFVESNFPEMPIDTSYIVGNVEIWPVVNPANPDEMSFAATIEDPNDIFPGGLARFTTTDNGVTWESEVLYVEEEWHETGNGDEIVYYLVQNFSQFNNMYTDDGTFHIVFNGYGISDLDGDTATVEDAFAIFPIVYWNDRDREFIEITEPESGHNTTQEFQDAVLSGYAGNGIGNAYPTLATYGPTLLCLWQSIELGEGGLPVQALDIEGNPSEFYATDIELTVSYNDGASWGCPIVIAGRPELNDAFPVVAREAGSSGGGPEIAFMYYQDADAGVSLFDQGVFAHGEWWYNKYELYIDNIEEGTAVTPQQVRLSQNYPNPFNPSTVISLQLATASNVTLSVFDVSGRLVTKLIDNQSFTSGDYDVVWDGTNSTGEAVASGVYFYSASHSQANSLLSRGAGGDVQTRKMLLLR